MFCVKCGNRITPAAMFCNACGNAVKHRQISGNNRPGTAPGSPGPIQGINMGGVARAAGSAMHSANSLIARAPFPKQQLAIAAASLLALAVIAAFVFAINRDSLSSHPLVGEWVSIQSLGGGHIFRAYYMFFEDGRGVSTANCSERGAMFFNVFSWDRVDSNTVSIVFDFDTTRTQLYEFTITSQGTLRLERGYSVMEYQRVQ